MPLDAQIDAILQLVTAAEPVDAATQTPADARRTFVEMAAALNSGESVAAAHDRTVPGPAGEIPVRIYMPHTLAGEAPYPALVFYHGGGFVVGDLGSYDPLCRAIANKAGCLLVSVDYRLAPEHKFPAGLDDAYAAALWVYNNAATLEIDPARIAVGGDSAGGNLSTLVAHLARERGTPPLVYQALIYPVTTQASESASYQAFAEGYFLTRDRMHWYRDHYLSGPAQRTDPLASPLLLHDLAGQPPALVITGEYDLLRDEGEAYGERLCEAGVPVTISRYDGMIHGFVSMAPFVDRGQDAIAEVGACLRAAFGAK